jgi:hypothetical protein
LCRGGGRHIPPPLRTWDWHEPVASGHRKVRRCHAGIGATAPRGGEFNATRNRLGTQRASTTPSFSRIAPTNRANSAASLARGGSAPQNGFRPLRIGLAAGDDVDVQLRHHVAQRGDIDLVALRHFFERQRASAISAIGGKASAPRSASSETTNSSIIGTSDHRIVEIYTLPCAPGGYAVSEQVRTAGPDGAEHPPSGPEKTQGPCRCNRGGFLTASAVVLALNGGPPFIKKDATLSIVAPAEITDASRTLDPATQRNLNRFPDATRRDYGLAPTPA